MIILLSSVPPAGVVLEVGRTANGAFVMLMLLPDEALGVYDHFAFFCVS